MAKKVLGGKYRVIGDTSSYLGKFGEGDVVYLIYDDGTSCPWFSKKVDGEYKDEGTRSLRMNDVELIEETNDEPDWDKLPIGQKLYHKETGKETEIIGYDSYYLSNTSTIYFENIEEFYSLTKPPKTTITLQQIADKFGIDIDEMEIE